MHLLQILALVPFLTPALARQHKQCDCWVQRSAGGAWEYEWQLTYNVCEETPAWKSIAGYDTSAGRCVAFPHERIDGDRWNGDCSASATGGYYPIVNGIVDVTAQPMKAAAGKGTCR